MRKRIIDFIIPNEIDFKDLPEEIKDNIIKTNLLCVMVVTVSFVLALFNLNEPFFLVVPAAMVVAWIIIYFTKTRPYFTGEVVIIEGPVVKIKQKEGNNNLINTKRKKVLNKKVVLKIDGNYCTFNAPSAKQYETGSFVRIYTRNDLISQKNENTFHITDYYYSTIAKSGFEEEEPEEEN